MRFKIYPTIILAIVSLSILFFTIQYQYQSLYQNKITESKIGNINHYNEPLKEVENKEPILSDKSSAALAVQPQDVPFTSQAPYGDWSDVRLQNACEEASVLMAVSWARGQTISSESALNDLLSMSRYTEEAIGHFHDTSAQDTFDRLVLGYFNFTNGRIVHNIGTEDIKRELAFGNIVIVPVHGQRLFNPFFTQPGPIEHTLVVTGYEYETDEFITNDPGTRRGIDFRYKSRTLENALRDYETGYHVQLESEKTSMIVISKES